MSPNPRSREGLYLKASTVDVGVHVGSSLDHVDVAGVQAAVCLVVPDGVLGVRLGEVADIFYLAERHLTGFTAGAAGRHGTGGLDVVTNSNSSRFRISTSRNRYIDRFRFYLEDSIIENIREHCRHHLIS